jgi:hypothetical protein
MLSSNRHGSTTHNERDTSFEEKISICFYPTFFSIFSNVNIELSHSMLNRTIKPMLPIRRSKIR